MKNRILCFLFIFSFLIIGCGELRTAQGKRLYLSKCANCHGDNGEGLRSLYPPLDGADYLSKHRDELVCIITDGLSDPIVVNGQTYHMPMPAMPELTPSEIHNILNYVLNSWSNELGYFTPKQVENDKMKCK